MTADEYADAVLQKVGLPLNGGSEEERLLRDLYLPGIRGSMSAGRSVDDAAKIFEAHAKLRGYPK